MAQDGTPVWFITGCSTAFGRELAKAVLDRGWRVVATARRTEQLDDLLAPYGERALKLRLDVTDHGEVVATVKEAEARLGSLVSFGATGDHHATKYAVEGLSDSLAVEVAPLGISDTLAEPGPFRTDWAGRSIVESKTVIDDDAETAGLRRKQAHERSGNQPGDPVRAAEAVIRAVTAKQPPLRLLLGAPALDLAYGKLDKLRANVDAWKDVTLGADCPEQQKTA